MFYCSGKSMCELNCVISVLQRKGCADLKKKKDVLISKKRKRKKKKGCAFSIEKQQIDGYHKNIWFDSL
jgi:hypothetical protein